jgi:hypothetical protein
MSRLSQETLVAGLRTARRLHKGERPANADLAVAPLLEDWALKEVAPGLFRLIGVVSGHPTIAGGWCSTSVPARVVARSTSGPCPHRCGGRRAGLRPRSGGLPVRQVRSLRSTYRTDQKYSVNPLWLSFFALILAATPKWITESPRLTLPAAKWPNYIRLPCQEHARGTRVKGAGPPFFTPTDKALYRSQDAEAWIEDAIVTQTTSVAPSSVGRPRKNTGPSAGRGRATPMPRLVEMPSSSRHGRKSMKIPGTGSSLAPAAAAVDEIKLLATAEGLSMNTLERSWIPASSGTAANRSSNSTRTT